LMIAITIFMEPVPRFILNGSDVLLLFRVLTNQGSCQAKKLNKINDKTSMAR